MTKFDVMLLFEGLPIKPLVYVKQQKIDIEEQFNYVSSDDEDSDDKDDKDWKPASEKEKLVKKEVKLKPGILKCTTLSCYLHMFLLYVNIFDPYATNFNDLHYLF